MTMRLADFCGLPDLDSSDDRTTAATAESFGIRPPIDRQDPDPKPGSSIATSLRAASGAIRRLFGRGVSVDALAAVYSLPAKEVLVVSQPTEEVRDQIRRMILRARAEGGLRATDEEVAALSEALEIRRARVTDLTEEELDAAILRALEVLE